MLRASEKVPKVPCRKMQRKIKEQPVENVIKAMAKKIDSGIKRDSKVPRVCDTWLPNVNHEKHENDTFQLSSVLGHETHDEQPVEKFYEYHKR